MSVDLIRVSLSLSLVDEIMGCQNNLAPKCCFVIRFNCYKPMFLQLVSWSGCVCQFDQGIVKLEFS